MRPTQIKLFEEISKVAPAHIDWKSVCMSLLNLGKSAFYKRLNGTTPLILEESVLLANHFGISLDRLMNPFKANVLFDFTSRTPLNLSTFDQYLKRLLNDLTLLSQAHQPNIFYATREFPIFHYMLSPVVFYFKIFAWCDAVPGSEKEISKKFSIKEYTGNDFLLPIKEEILQRFYQINCTEIWATGVLENTLQQVEYYFESRRFENPGDALQICDGLRKIVDALYEMANTGNRILNEKKIDRNFLLYQNEIIHTNNTILVETDQRSIVYTTYDNPNFLKTTDPDFCKYTRSWFDNLLSFSTPVTITNARKRERLFTDIKDRINGTEKTIITTLQKTTIEE